MPARRLKAHPRRSPEGLSEFGPELASRIANEWH
jgi:hypothetical protein